MAVLPDDPLFQYQWFLRNTGQSGGGIGKDINVLPVWPDYTGKGVRVAIVDDGVLLDHPDLAKNIDLAGSWDAETNSPGGGPVDPDDNHGTPVAGLVAEVANNKIGGTGVAPDATLLAYRMDFQTPSATIAFQKALENKADVVNNSWGDDTAFFYDAQNPDQEPFFEALYALGSEGRGGNGSIIVYANGNQGAKAYDSNLDNAMNNRYVVAVGALDDNGVRSAYSTPGANLLVSAPGGAPTDQHSNQPGTGTLTTNRAGDYDYNFNGTSASAPIVSGVVALMLSANAKLGYRDVQEILAHSAQFVDPAASSWTTTKSGTWNGGGAVFSTDYGFGEVDAHGAVRLAEVYPYLHAAPRSDANVKDVTATTGPIDVTADPDDSAHIKLTLPGGVDLLDLNHLDLTIDASFANPSEMSIHLTSPSGTTIALLSNPQNALTVVTKGDPSIKAIPWPDHGYTLGTDAFWGEQSAGDWEIQIDVVKGGTGGTINDVTLTGYGDTHSNEREFVYTDSFSGIITADSWRQDAPSRTTLEVGDGETAVINAAAVSGDVTVNLGSHSAQIDGQSITIDPATKVTKVFTGDGNDSIVGDGNDNSLLAGRGTNTIDGGGGSDTALFIGSRADYTANFSSTGTFTAGTLSHDASDTTVRIEKAAFSEGTLYVQAASDTGLGIAALYNGLLFRDADGGGYGYWTTEAAHGASLGGIGASFLASAEYANGAGKLDNATFINDVYQNLLHRAPDAGGAAYWNAELTSGALTRAGLVISIDHSTEYQTTQLTGVFTAINDLGNVWS